MTRDETGAGAPPVPRSTPLTPEVLEVAAGLVFRDGKLLITRRPHTAHLGGLWEFPGGKRQPHETFEACLERELREELGIEVAVGALVESIDHEYPDRPVHLRFFHCGWRSGVARPIGCAALAWIGPEELTGYEFPAADARLLATLRSQTDWWV